MTLRRTAFCAVGVAVALVSPAVAAPGEESDKYAVMAPVPFPMTSDVPSFDGCWNGEETLTKNTRALTFKKAGTLTAQVSYLGDWDLLLFDAKGAKIAASETTDLGGPATAAKEKITFKKIKAGEKYELVVCNWAGQKDATVEYTFVPGKK